ncbi:MAG: transposase [Actinomycetota bacterium]
MRRGAREKEPVYLAQGTDLEGSPGDSGLLGDGGSGESSLAWEEIFSEMEERGAERIDIVVSDDLPGIENAGSKVFPS